MAGGGVPGKVTGIVLAITTGAGPIIARSPYSILMWIRVGENITGIITGMDTGGTTRGFLTKGFTMNGRSGVITDIGKGRETGVYMTTAPTHHIRGRNCGVSGKSNINGDQRSSGKRGAQGDRRSFL